MQSEDAGVGIGYLGSGEESYGFILLADRDRTTPGTWRTDQGSDMAICGEGALCTEKFRDP